MRRPPPCVAFVARTHWVVGLIIAASIVLLHWITRGLPAIEFETRTYLITGSLAALYLITGTLVWFGAPLGRFFSRICGLLYLPRPQFGGRVWDTMNLPEFKAHFQNRKPDTGYRKGERQA